MDATDTRTPRADDARALIIWGAILFGVGALTAVLFLERVMQWPLGSLPPAPGAAARTGPRALAAGFAPSSSSRCLAAPGRRW